MAWGNQPSHCEHQARDEQVAIPYDGELAHVPLPQVLKYCNTPMCTSVWLLDVKLRISVRHQAQRGCSQPKQIRIVVHAPYRRPDTRRTPLELCAHACRLQLCEGKNPLVLVLALRVSIDVGPFLACSWCFLLVHDALRLQQSRSPFKLAGEDVVAGLLLQGLNGLLQAHVEAQPLAHVVPHLDVQTQLALHATSSGLQDAITSAPQSTVKDTPRLVLIVALVLGPGLGPGPSDPSIDLLLPSAIIADHGKACAGCHSSPASLRKHPEKQVAGTE